MRYPIQRTYHGESDLSLERGMLWSRNLGAVRKSDPCSFLLINRATRTAAFLVCCLALEQPAVPWSDGPDPQHELRPAAGHEAAVARVGRVGQVVQGQQLRDGLGVAQPGHRLVPHVEDGAHHHHRLTPEGVMVTVDTANKKTSLQLFLPDGGEVDRGAPALVDPGGGGRPQQGHLPGQGEPMLGAFATYFALFRT